MDIGVGLDFRLGLSLGELEELGREALRLGFDSLWTPAGTVPDSFHVCGMWAEATAEVSGTPLRTGIGVVPVPRMWRVESLALQAATVSLRSDGTFVLGIGTGGAGAEHFAAAGLANLPLAVMRDYLEILRPMLAGEQVDYAGRALSFKGSPPSGTFKPVPVYLAALGPQMLRLGGAAADGVCLNWATPETVASSKEEIARGAHHAGRSATVPVSMYIRVCVDEDEVAARRALAAQVLGYAMVRPGADPTLAYRGHFARMGFEEVLCDLEARRDAGASAEELADAAPDELLRAVGYFGPAEGAASAYARLAEGLDETIVRIIGARRGSAAVVEAMEALRPSKIRAAAGKG